MKKITPEMQQRLSAIGKARWLQELSRRDHHYGHRAQSSPRIKITAPETMSFQANFSETVEFFEKFREVISKNRDRRQRVHIDLAKIERLSVPAAIVLAAEFHRWSILLNKRLRVIDAPNWSPSVRNLLSDLGVFKLLGLESLSDELSDDNLTLTRLMSGTSTDGRKINKLQEEFEGVLIGFTKNPEIFAGLMEAAENAIAHAYPEGYSAKHPVAGHRWWAASCLDMEKMVLRFFVFDQGAGIPFTLPTATLYEQVRARLAQMLGDLIPNDSLMLKAALEVGRTRTGLEYRGLGLKRMSDVVTGADKGSLRILSGKGEIVYYSDQTIVTRDHDSHIGGTLIEWSMSADAFTDSSKDLPDEND